MKHSNLIICGAVLAAITGCRSVDRACGNISAEHARDIATGKRQGTTVIESKRDSLSISNQYRDGDRVISEGYAKKRHNAVYYNTDGLGFQVENPKVSRLATGETLESETSLSMPAVVVEPVVQLPDSPTIAKPVKEESIEPEILAEPVLRKKIIRTRISIGLQDKAMVYE